MFELTIAPTATPIVEFNVTPPTVIASASSVPFISTLPSISKLSAVTAPVTVIVSVNVSLNLKAVVPKSRSLSVIGCNAAVTNFNSFAPAALKIMLLSVAKFISLSASLPIAKAAFLRDVIDV